MRLTNIAVPNQSKTLQALAVRHTYNVLTQPNLVLPELNYAHPYLSNRLLPVDWAQYFQVGEYDNRIWWTVHDLYGNYVQRVPRVLDSSQPKYDFSGLSKTHYLFNYHRAREAKRRAVVLVEGFFDTVRVVQAGYPSTVALMGSAMSELQEQYLTRYWDYVILMLDGDKTGRQAQADYAKRLSKRGLKGVYQVNLPDSVQPDTCSFQQIRSLLSQPVQ